MNIIECITKFQWLYNYTNNCKYIEYKYKYNCMNSCYVFLISLDMPINVFGNNDSNDKKSKIDTSLFVQKPFLRTNYIEANIEEDIDLKNQYRINNLPDPISIGEPTPEEYVDNLFNDPSILKNTTHIDLNDRNITNARFIQVNQFSRTDSHLTAKLYVENAIDEPSSVRNNQDNDFGN